jgi:hypothetical protein
MTWSGWGLCAGAGDILVRLWRPPTLPNDRRIPEGAKCNRNKDYYGSVIGCIYIANAASTHSADDQAFIDAVSNRADTEWDAAEFGRD